VPRPIQSGDARSNDVSKFAKFLPCGPLTCGRPEYLTVERECRYFKSPKMPGSSPLLVLERNFAALHALVFAGKDFGICRGKNKSS
jgi:hypothetical protein